MPTDGESVMNRIAYWVMPKEEKYAAIRNGVRSGLIALYRAEHGNLQNAMAIARAISRNRHDTPEYMIEYRAFFATINHKKGKPPVRHWL